MRKALAVCLLATAAVTGSAFAGAQARMSGKIIDAVTKKPIANATVRIVAAEAKHFDETYNAKADGTYQLILVDGTIRYKVTFAAPGYAPYEETMKLKIGGENNEKNVELAPGNAVPAGAPPASRAPDPSITGYNEGAALFNAGKTEESIAKFKEVVAAKPDMIAGWEALARAYLKVKDYPHAIEAAQKALAIADDETEMYQVLYESYTATGDKVKAAEAKKKMPADPVTLFNDAASLINAGKDAQAEPLLKQAIAANDKFGQAYYELGMIYVRSGKNADAKANLTKYIEVDPSGKDVATAKEMLKYVQ